MKKVISLVLALALVLAVAVPAFASTPNVTQLGQGATTNLNAAAYAPDIKIVVPTSGQVLLNPYGLTAKFDSTDTGSSNTVYSELQQIENQSDCDINVGATVTGTPATGVTLLTAAPVETDTKNSVLLQFIAATPAATAPTALPASGAGALEATVAAKAVTATSDGTAAGTKTVTLADKDAGDDTNKLVFGLIGEANPNAAIAWTTKMTVKVAIAFTFTPAA